MMKSVHRYIFLFGMIAACSAAFLSCQKVIDVDLNSSNPEIVIEGSVSDQPGPYLVTISQTVNYDQTNTFPSVNDAIVTLSDDQGNSERLTETSSGTYESSMMIGTSGRTYTLTVLANGMTYSASSTMPLPIIIDSLSQSNLSLGMNNSKTVEVHFQDPAGIKNYYRFVEIKNGVEQKYIFLYDDRMQDGSAITSNLSADEDTLRTGDSVLVFLQCVDKGMFDYFRTLQQAIGGGGLQAASPANPVSNFNNGALGYFNAYAVKSKLIVIP
jgi:hypothetical protein